MRISAISYLNTAPLMWDFEHGGAGKEFEISYTVPSQCAVELQSGSADIGIIPSAAYATVPGLAILPGVAIAAKQAVRSILLVGKKPIEEIRTVALDSSSLTSVALVRILFERYWKSAPGFESLPPDLGTMLKEHDAALLIGDPALQVERTKFFTWDLAEEWIRFTGKPFVFAFWAVAQAAVERTSVDLAAIFQQSRDHGLEPESLAMIAEEWSPRLGMPRMEVLEYLTANIYYYLDESCLEGLRAFYQYAYECSVLPRIPNLDFVEARPALR
jgi:chorismate dehydratase